MSVLTKSSVEIWVGNECAYNCGELKGEWISLPSIDLKETLKDIAKYGEHIDCDISIMDTSIEIHGLEIRGIQEAIKINDLLFDFENLYEHEQEIVLAIIAETDYDFEDAMDKYEDFYILSDVNCDEEYGYYCFDEFYDKKQVGNLENFIDYKALGESWRPYESWYTEGGLLIYNG
jgi:hypothetical protein